MVHAGQPAADERRPRSSDKPHSLPALVGTAVVRALLASTFNPQFFYSTMMASLGPVEEPFHLLDLALAPDEADALQWRLFLCSKLMRKPT